MAENIFLGLGANLGDRRQNLESAIDQLNAILTIKTTSHIYETQPWGFQEQDPFLNMVLKCSSIFSPSNLLSELKKIERKIGRVPTFKNGPRVIDIDILYYDYVMLNQDHLIIPHPNIAERDFVLYPLCEIAPHYVHPKLVKSSIDLLRDFQSTDIKLLQFPFIPADLLKSLLINPPLLEIYLSLPEEKQKHFLLLINKSSIEEEDREKNIKEIVNKLNSSI